MAGILLLFVVHLGESICRLYALICSTLTMQVGSSLTVDVEGRVVAARRRRDITGPLIVYVAFPSLVSQSAILLYFTLTSITNCTSGE